MTRLDPHSFADDQQPSTKRFSLDLFVDFEARILRGTVTLCLDRPAEGVLDLDSRGLTIESVVDASGHPIEHQCGGRDAILGERLRLRTTASEVTIKYRTAPIASALQWLDAAQTRSGRPYVFTQCQAIHARSVVPCQDTPRVRSTYSAALNVPRSLVAVMAASAQGSRDVEGLRTVFRFEMPEAIPSYLLAFAVGNITQRDLDARTRIYAEPATIDAAAEEFENVPALITKAEALFGSYPWTRFDLLVMPPSFPYGGMENPRLTFVTPTLLAGDRSLVNVVAHELAHSWTGNLITNASMNDFWLNEGFTVYAERRILEATEGHESMALHAALGRDGLERDLRRLSAIDPKLTRLRTQLEGVDPDEVYSLVPYEKGFLFLVLLEAKVGRDRFDQFLLAYIDRFRFTSITTDEFLAFLREALPGIEADVDLGAWIDGEGLPPDAPSFTSARLQTIQGLLEAWGRGERPDAGKLKAFDATEWQVLLSQLPHNMPIADCAWLDQGFRLSRIENAEIRVGWLTIAAASRYVPAYDAIRETLLSVGRMKYLRPLYAALIQSGTRGFDFAAEVFAQARSGYHPVAEALISSMISNAQTSSGADARDVT
ncbi:MAG: M1 family metallopeptidase [Deltaproteobacteria bacterium]|nr:M1 family metallopeptidase [Deltaproteobacteria bacterium]